MAWYDEMSSNSDYFDDDEEKRRRELASRGNLNSLSDPNATDDEMFSAMDTFGKQTQDQGATPSNIVDFAKNFFGAGGDQKVPGADLRSMPQTPVAPIAPAQAPRTVEQPQPQQQQIQQVNPAAALSPGETIVQQPGQAPVAVPAQPVAPAQQMAAPVAGPVPQPVPQPVAQPVAQPATPQVSAPATPVAPAPQMAAPVAPVAPTQQQIQQQQEVENLANGGNQQPMEQAGPALPADFNQPEAIQQADTASKAYGVLANPHATQQDRVMMMADSNLPQSVRDDLKTQFIENDKHQAGIQQAREIATKAADGDRSAQKIVSKEMENNEGSYIKMMFMSALGLKEAATAEAAKLGIGSTVQRVGDDGYVTVNAAGRAITGYKVDKDGNKTSMTASELAMADIGGMKTLRTQADHAANTTMEAMRKENQKLIDAGLSPKYTEEQIVAKGKDTFNQTMSVRGPGAATESAPAGSRSPSAPATGTGKTISERNNNPGNIVGPDGKFAKFATEEEGRAALERDLTGKIGGTSKAYKAKWGDAPVTAERLAEVWSPASAPGNSIESTYNYGKSIAKALGIKSDETIPNTPEAIARVADAITAFERGTGSGNINKPSAGGTATPTTKQTASDPYDLSQSKILSNWTDARPGESTENRIKRTAISADTVNDLATELANGNILPKDISGRNSDVRTFAMQRAKEINPNWTPRDAIVMNKTAQDFSTGKQGDTVRSLDVAVHHTEVMRGLIGNLKNGKYKTFNEITQRYSELTGEPAPSSFDAAKEIVGDEIAKAIVGGRNAEGDRKALKASLDRSKSPEMLNDVLDKYADLMGGQLKGLRRQYTNSGLTEDSFNTKLDPNTLRVLDSHNKPNTTGAAQTAPTAYKDPNEEAAYQQWKAKQKVR